MTTYLGRSAWTATQAGGATLTGGSLVGVAVHWPGTTLAAFGVESQAKVASRLRGWRDFHINGRKWADIGYNFAIDQAGRVWMLRSTTWRGSKVGAHSASSSNPNANHHRVGVLLILGATEQPSAAMIAAFRDWRHSRFLVGWSGRTDLRGHGQVPGASTSCPGPRTRALISDGTLAGKSGGTVTPPPPNSGGNTMSWTATLAATKTAAGRIKDSYSLRAEHVLTHILGIVYQNMYGKVALNAATLKRFPSLPKAGYTQRVLARAGYGRILMIEEDVAKGFAKVQQEQAKSAARQAALEDLLHQILDTPGQPIDMAQVAEAARLGAQESLSALEVRIEINPAQEPDGSSDSDD